MKLKYIYIIMFASVIGLAGCSGSGDTAVTTPPVIDSNEPISFATNLDKDVWQDLPTRATTGVISDLKTVPEGFGVIAYLTDNQTWIAAKSGIDNYTTSGNFPRPDFMFDQPVTWNTTLNRWGYSPMKYWPNSTENATNRYVSFFAYAPFVEGTVIDAASGTGVTGMTWADDLRPHIIYTVDEEGTNPVDLLWAHYEDATRNGQGLIYYESETEKWQVVPLEFKHALSCLDVYVQRVYDEPTYSGKDTPANTTKLYMQQLKLTSTNTALNGLFKKGRLDLENGTWSSFADANNGNAQAWQAGEFSLTFPVSAFVSNLAGTLSTNSTDIRNEELEKWGVADTGVNKDEQLLFKAGSIMLIPQSDALTITPSIKYSMVTRGDEGDLIYSPLVDAAGNHYSRLLNDVTGNAISIKLEPAKRYKLVIRIGVEHVEFVVASVEDWDFPIRVNPSTSGSGEEQISHTLKED